jgi:hypothetical protein
MARLGPGLDLPGTLFDGDPLWNMEGFMPMGMRTEPTPLVSSGKIGEEVLLRTGRFIVEELINGLMADSKIRIF